ncbi:MAG: hypothetical protein HeimC3_18650 [Candidatus Heimdallarchaeota archaeon LC_3]|nr:MAG: hypothetical protein HeimC3_18650 [Candidatus Heimdallarchaeota archaeon LC_3]
MKSINKITKIVIGSNTVSNNSNIDSLYRFLPYLYVNIEKKATFNANNPQINVKKENLILKKIT